MKKSMKRGNVGGGASAGFIQGHMAGFMSIIFGCVSLVICLITYLIALGQLDDAYTAAATYTEQVGLTDVMGIWPMVIFLVFMFIGLALIGAGAAVQVKKTVSGGWTDIFLGIVFGTVTIVIATILNNVIQGQLHTVYVTAANVSETANIASFAGLLDIMKIFGMVIFITLLSSGIAQLAGSAWGGFKNIKQLF